MGAARDVALVVRTYWSLMLGNTLEWYEFCIFSFLEPYFEANFFQGSSVATWMGFAITFVARPFGGTVLGLVGDIFGRKVSTFLSIFGMLFGTVGQGLLPSYRNGDVAGHIGLILLILLRIIQGISTGGEIAAVPTYLTEVGARKSLGCCIALVPVTSQIGYFLAQLICFGAGEILGQEAMECWGWRLPFLLALLPGLSAALGRRSIPESAAYLDAKSDAEAPADSRGSRSEALKKTRELVAAYGPAILVGFGSTAAISVLQYGAMTWGLVSLQKRGISGPVRIAAAAVCNALVIFLAPLLGLWADKRGAGFVQLVASSALAVLGAPLLLAVDAATTPELIIVLYGLGYGVLGALFPMHFLQAVELFPVDVRNAGMGLSYNVGVCLFGGFAPMLFEASGQVLPAAPALLLACGGLVTVCSTLISLHLQAQGSLRLTHIRSEPYFRLCGKEMFAPPGKPEQPDLSPPGKPGTTDPSPQKQGACRPPPEAPEIHSVVAL